MIIKRSKFVGKAMAGQEVVTTQISQHHFTTQHNGGDEFYRTSAMDQAAALAEHEALVSALLYSCKTARVVVSEPAKAQSQMSLL